MTDTEFMTWATDIGIPADAATTILRVAAIPLQSKTVRTDCLYCPDDIHDLFVRNGFRVSPQQSGFVFIGGCANGDPIAIDIAYDLGSIGYIDHGNMHHNPLRKCSIRIADDLPTAYAAITSNRTFPIDYYSAQRVLGKS